jgi:hypothetical protein
MPKKRSFRYRRRPAADIQERGRHAQFDDDFKIGLREARKKNPQQLCTLLRSSEPLSDQHRAGLADLIENQLQARKTKGRPRGSVLDHPRQEFERLIINAVEKELVKLRDKNDGRVRRGMVDQTIEEVVNRFGEIYGGEPGLKDVDLNNIRNALKRGKTQKSLSL